jgi:DNA polymerase-3 subunit delta'
MEAANAFLKTLEEPPAQSIMILLSTDGERLLDTILSRCLRLNFGGESAVLKNTTFLNWLENFARTAAESSGSLLGRYRLLSLILSHLTSQKEIIKEQLEESSPIERHEDLDPKIKDRWTAELNASIESEYRRFRSELVTGLQWWFRDVWLDTLQVDGALRVYPDLSQSIRVVAERVTPEDAMDNLQQLEKTQRLLNTNVQEALTLEVGLLNLKF